MNKDAGEKAQSELNKAFGDGSIFFFACDVTKYSDLESELMIRLDCIYTRYIALVIDFSSRQIVKEQDTVSLFFGQ